MYRPTITARAVFSVIPELRNVLFQAIHTPSFGKTKSTARPFPPHLSSADARGASRYDPESTLDGRRGRTPRNVTVDPKRGPQIGRLPSTSSRRLAELRLSSRTRTRPIPAVELAKPKAFTDFPLHQGLLDILPSVLGSHTEAEGTEGIEGIRTTPIQSITLSHLLNNPTDGLIAAETGSGKTLAYISPLLHHLKATDTFSSPLPLPSQSDSGPAFLADIPSSPNQLSPRSLIISPTHELTRQNTSVAKALSHGIKLSVMGMSNTKDGIGSRRGGVDVLVGTSGGFRRGLGIRREGEDSQIWGRERKRKANEEDVDEDETHDERGRKERSGPKLGLERVEWVVIDEADVLLGPSFISETTSIISLLPADTKILLCTATLPPSLLSALSSHPLLSNRSIPQFLAPGLHKLPAGVKTHFIGDTGGHLAARVVREVKEAFVEDAQEERSLGASPRKGGKTKTVVFCNTDNRAREVIRKFREKEPDLGVLEWTTTGNNRLKGSQGDLAPFLSSSSSSSSSSAKLGPPTSASTDRSNPHPEPRILITTSLLSRGLDFNERVKTVVLVDPPRDTLDFVHRAGRTGRAGRSGRVIVFGMGGSVGGGKGLKGRGRVGEGMAGVIRRR